jgi:hypothetical protein
VPYPATRKEEWTSSLLLGRAREPTDPRLQAQGMQVLTAERRTAEPLGRYCGHSRQLSVLAVDIRALTSF